MAFSLKSTSSLLSRYPLLSGLALQPQSLSLSPLRTYATAPSPPQAATVSVQSSSSSSRSTQKPSNHILPWHEYFTARKKRKRYDLGGSVFTAATAASGAWNGLSSLDIDKMMSGELILGMDPLMFLGLATVGITFIGWVVGPTIGTAVFFLFRGREFKRVTIQVSYYTTTDYLDWSLLADDGVLGRETRISSSG